MEFKAISKMPSDEILKWALDQCGDTLTSQEHNDWIAKKGFDTKSSNAVKKLAFQFRERHCIQMQSVHTWRKKAPKNTPISFDHSQKGGNKEMLSKSQIETIAEFFASREAALVSGQNVKWVLSHAFQLGVQFGIDYLSRQNEQ